MKQPPDIRASVFQADSGWWRIRYERTVDHMDADDLERWFADGYTAEDLEPYLYAGHFETDHDAHLQVLSSYIGDFADGYHPQLQVDVLDPDEDMTHRPRLLRRLRELAAEEAT